MQRQSWLTTCLSGLLIMSLSSCYTIHNWDEGPPPDPASLDQAQRKQIYKKYAIRGIQGRTMTTEAAPEKMYSLDSFKPVMEIITPEVSQPLRHADNMELWSTVSSTLGSLGLILTLNTFNTYLVKDQELRENLNYLGWGTWALGLGGALLFGVLQQGANEEAQRIYLKGLNQYIYQTPSLNSQLPTPRLELSELDGTPVTH